MTAIVPRDTSTERLLAVADLIETHPDAWNQRSWTNLPRDWPDDLRAVRPAPERGTRCCIAGWGVVHCPDNLYLPSDWYEAGEVAFDLAPDLAAVIFDPGYRPTSMPGVLRLIATLPEDGRTLRAAVDAGLRDLTGADLDGAWWGRAAPAPAGWDTDPYGRLREVTR